MAISEACQLWIEQRIKEELETQPVSTKSLRSIGRELAKEIERVFETKINPHTIADRARRMRGANAPQEPTTLDDYVIEENQIIKVCRGGARLGAGRKPNGRNKYAVCPKCGHIFKSKEGRIVRHE